MQQCKKIIITWIDPQCQFLSLALIVSCDLRLVSREGSRIWGLNKLVQDTKSLHSPHRGTLLVVGSSLIKINSESINSPYSFHQGSQVCTPCQCSQPAHRDPGSRCHHRSWTCYACSRRWMDWPVSRERGRRGGRARWGGGPWFQGSSPPPPRWCAAGPGFLDATSAACWVRPGPRYTYRYCKE